MGQYDELLKICDRYPYRVPIKGGFRQFTSECIIITSNSEPDQWYKFDAYNGGAALVRRIDINLIALEGGGISAESEDRMVQRWKDELIELGHEISQLRFEIWEGKNPIKKRQWSSKLKPPTHNHNICLVILILAILRSMDDALPDLTWRKKSSLRCN